MTGIAIIIIGMCLTAAVVWCGIIDDVISRKPKLEQDIIFGARGCLLIDDPWGKFENVPELSSERKAEVLKMFEETVNKRIHKAMRVPEHMLGDNNHEHGAMLFIQSRVHDEDQIGIIEEVIDDERERAFAKAYAFCPICNGSISYSHRYGTPVKRCDTSQCKNNERWLEYAHFLEANDGKRL